MFLDQAKSIPAALLQTPEIPTSQISFSKDTWAKPAPPVSILGIPFDNLTMLEAVERIQLMIKSGEPHYVVTPNVDFLVRAARDSDLRRVLIDAHLVLCDGTPLVWASRWLGNPLPERVAGADLVPELIRVAAQNGHKIFFLGATEESNADAVANVRRQYRDIKIVGHYSPPFAPWEEMDHADIVRRVREAKPDLLLVAFGCPKAEKWMAMNFRALGVPVVIGVGATIDFLAGRMRRAPRWMQRSGTEWIYRLLQEPRRLFARYATDLWGFSWGFLSQLRLVNFSNWNSGTLHAPNAQTSRGRAGSDWEYLRLPSRLDITTVNDGNRLWRQSVTKDCALELSNVRVIDSTGVALLLRLQAKFRDAGKQLVLLSPSRPVERVLRAMRVREFFVVGRAENLRPQARRPILFKERMA